MLNFEKPLTPGFSTCRFFARDSTVESPQAPLVLASDINLSISLYKLINSELTALSVACWADIIFSFI